MEKTKIACAASNFASGRPPGIRPEAIVLHRTGGTADQTRVRFLDAATVTSAHYFVGLDGRAVQYVAEQDTAFHAGVVVNPTCGLCLSKPRVNPNFYTIGIEMEGSPGDPFPDEQLDGTAKLVAEIAARWGIALDKDHIVLHSEIRASRNCPGPTFQRDDLLQRALVAATSPALEACDMEVAILRDSNLREGVASSSARIVSIFTAGSKVRVNAFTRQGEDVQGNSAWYQVDGGNFFWAGNSSIPQPDSQTAEDEAGAAASPAPPTPEETISAGLIGIAVIDLFFTAATAPPVDLANAGRETIGVVQDLLTGHGFRKQPTVLAPGYGVCGSATSEALRSFQTQCGLPADGTLTQLTMKQLVALPASDPRASQAHFALVLDIPYKGMERVLAITAQMEGAGKFAAMNLNTDGAGLSFGLIQWSQSTGRLLEIVRAFRDADAETFLNVFGDGDSAVGDRLIAHLKQPNGGVVPKTGTTTDPELDLIASPWAERFQQAALNVAWQKVQVETARKAFESSLGRMRQYDTAGLVKSERAVAFMLDVANQFGDGSVQPPAPPNRDRGLAGLYRKVFRRGMQELELINGIADATVAAMEARFQTGVSARRTLFLTTSLFSDREAFQDS